MKRQLEIPQASVGDIERVHDFVDEVCSEIRADEDSRFAIKLAVEEAFNNIVVHGYGDDTAGPIWLTMETDTNSIVVSLLDNAPPFVSDQVPSPDLSADWQARPIGGLGWYLIRQMMDEVRHELIPTGGNRLTLVKRFSSHS